MLSTDEWRNGPAVRDRQRVSAAANCSAALRVGSAAASLPADACLERDPGTKLVPKRSTRMARYSRPQTDGLAAALGIHLAIYCAVGGCFAFGLYALLQPSRFPNPGLTAYKPPPGTVITYVPSFRNEAEAIVPAALVEPELETIGRSTHQPEPETMATSAPRPNEMEKSRREVKTESPRQQRAVCIPGYDSSGAQTRPC
jgi:hypothetical protein